MMTDEFSLPEPEIFDCWICGRRSEGTKICRECYEVNKAFEKMGFESMIEMERRLR